MVIIGIVGHPGSGKTEFSHFLSQNWGFEAHALPFLDYISLLKDTTELNESSITQFLKKDQTFFEKSMEICKKQLLDYEKNQVIFPIFSLDQVKFMR